MTVGRVADDDLVTTVSEGGGGSKEDDSPKSSDRQTDSLGMHSNCETLQPAVGPSLRNAEFVPICETSNGDVPLYSAHSASGCDSNATLPSERQNMFTVEESHTRGRNLCARSEGDRSRGVGGRIYTQSVQLDVQTGSVQGRDVKQSEILGGGKN